MMYRMGNLGRWVDDKSTDLHPQASFVGVCLSGGSARVGKGQKLTIAAGNRASGEQWLLGLVG